MLGELVPTTAGKWIIHPTTRCPNGHTLGPNHVLVGHQACLGHGGGHTTWTCRTCGATVYGPPLNSHCTTLDGPAMLSYARSGDTVIVVALDRLGRSAGEVTRTVADLTDRGIRLQTLKEGLDTGTATGRVVAHIIKSLAQLDLEREHQRS